MRQYYLLFFILFCLAISVFYSCANPIRPEGGPRDKQAPGVDSTRSTPFSSTNFNDGKIIIHFDEWVQLNEPQKQIVISPPPEKFPEVRIKKKSVVLEFQEDLRPNTTYTVNFGEAVEDLTEKNKAKDLRFVFSTGDFIDSLEVKGSVVNAFSGQPQEDILVMLYEGKEDSVIYKEKPFYFARTKGSGSFKIENLKAGTYKILALKDENFNYKFDLPNEQIAFVEKDIIVADSFVNNLKFLLFEEEKELELKNADAVQYGFVKFEFNQQPRKVRLQHITDQQDFKNYAEIEGDSVLYWFDMTSETEKQQFALYNTKGLKDTVSLKIPTKEAFLEKKPKLKPMLRTSDQGTVRLGGDAGKAQEKYEAAIATAKRQDIPPGKPAEIRFNYPLYKVDGAQILLFEDSIKRQVVPGFDVKKEDRRTLLLDYEWKEDMKYELLIPAEALTDIYGLTNDSLKLPYHINKTGDYSTLDLTVDSLENDKNYLIELLDSKDNIIKNFAVSKGETFTYSFPMLLPANYAVRIIEDNNKNGKWDSGNYLEKRQPEKVYIKSITGLRPDWDVETIVNLKDIPAAGQTKKGEPGESGTIPAGNRPKSLGKGRN